MEIGKSGSEDTCPLCHGLGSMGTSRPPADLHFCLDCHTTIQGLEAYVDHKKLSCPSLDQENRGRSSGSFQLEVKQETNDADSSMYDDDGSIDSDLFEHFEDMNKDKSDVASNHRVGRHAEISKESTMFQAGPEISLRKPQSMGLTTSTDLASIKQTLLILQSKYQQTDVQGNASHSNPELQEHPDKNSPENGGYPDNMAEAPNDDVHDNEIVCFQCTTPISNLYDYIRHFVKKHIGKSRGILLDPEFQKIAFYLSPFQCEICGFHCNAYEHFLNHMNYNKHKICIDADRVLMDCSTCNFSTENYDEMVSHIRSESHALAQPDKPCILKFPSRGKSVIRANQKDSSDVLHSDDPQDLVNHIGSNPSAEHQFKCELCNVSFGSKSMLAQHNASMKHLIAVSSSECRKRKYPLIDDPQPNTEDVNSIVGDYKENSKKDSADQMANKNSKECGSQSLLDSDITTPARGDTLCTQCGQNLSSYNALVVHIRRKHTKNRPYKCEPCDSFFCTNSDLTSHRHSKRHLKIVNKSMPSDNDFGQEKLTPKRRKLNGKQGNSPDQSSDEDVKGLPGVSDGETENSTEHKNQNNLYADADDCASDVDKEDLSNSEPEYTPIKKRVGSRSRKSRSQRSRSKKTRKIGPQKSQIRKKEKPIKQFLKVVITEEGAETYVCVGCGFKSNSRPEAEQHVQDNHKGGRLISCQHCDYKGAYATIVKHYMARHESLTFKCEPCGLQFLSQVELDAHILRPKHQRIEKDSKATGGEGFSCTVCGRIFYRMEQFSYHMLTHVGSEDKKHKLEQIPDKFHLFVHEELLKKKNTENATCPECQKTFKVSNMIPHLRWHGDKANRPYVCKFCEKSFTCAGLLSTHHKLHLNAFNIRCQFCDQSFRCQEKLVHHEILQHPDQTSYSRDHQCDVCGAKFTTRVSLKTHQKQHLEKNLKCPYEGCVRVYSHGTFLRAHIRYTHREEKPHLCDECGFCTKTKQHLERHRKIHTNVHRFKCDFCPYSAHHSGGIKRHMRIHSGSKPFKCPHCDYTCNCITNLRLHVSKNKKHPGLFMYNCPRCEMGTNESKEFQSHMINEHDVSPDDVRVPSIYVGIYVKDDPIQQIQSSAVVLPNPPRKKNQTVKSQEVVSYTEPYIPEPPGVPHGSNIEQSSSQVYVSDEFFKNIIPQFGEQSIYFPKA